jgi:two-component system capsular synthesis response regulator RcsB
MRPGIPKVARTLVADDHPLVLAAVGKELSGTHKIHVVKSVLSGAELLKALMEMQIDLVVTDFVMPLPGAGSSRDDGLPLLAYIRRQYPRTLIVVFTMISNGGLLTKILDLGIHAVVGKIEPPGALTEACVRVLEGAKTPILGRSVAQRLGVHRDTVPTKSSRLSPRELEVVRLFASGLSLTEIAQRISRAVTTVATQKQTAMRKLNLQSNADLIRYATAEGLI